MKWTHRAVCITLPVDLIEKINDYRIETKPISNFSQAIEDLVRKSLEGESKT
jgi:metal-responsive CopG/Arc/MetJ family transcriptional regulator